MRQDLLRLYYTFNISSNGGGKMVKILTILTITFLMVLGFQSSIYSKAKITPNQSDKMLILNYLKADVSEAKKKMFIKNVTKWCSKNNYNSILLCMKKLKEHDKRISKMSTPYCSCGNSSGYLYNATVDGCTDC